MTYKCISNYELVVTDRVHPLKSYASIQPIEIVGCQRNTVVLFKLNSNKFDLNTLLTSRNSHFECSSNSQAKMKLTNYIAG
jgi:hypothetical protein